MNTQNLALFAILVITGALCIVSNAGLIQVCNYVGSLCDIQDENVYCLTNGTKVIGYCSAHAAVCEEGAAIDETFVSCLSNATIWCDNEWTTSEPCVEDYECYCLVNETIIIGSCNAYNAVCREGATIDETFASCHSNATIWCDNEWTTPEPCVEDYEYYCLTNGTIIFGSCNAYIAVCREGRVIDIAFNSCTDHGYTFTPMY